MAPSNELMGLLLLLNKHSRRMTLWQDSSMILNWHEFSKDVLGEPDKEWPYWDYYTDEQASELFDRVMATEVVTYYAAPKDCFSQIQGMRNAAKAGHSITLMEDMS